MLCHQIRRYLSWQLLITVKKAILHLTILQYFGHLNETNCFSFKIVSPIRLFSLNPVLCACEWTDLGQQALVLGVDAEARDAAGGQAWAVRQLLHSADLRHGTPLLLLLLRWRRQDLHIVWFLCIR